MKLDDYVKQTLLDITNGVANAQAESRLWIAPGRVEGAPRIDPQLVSFEVAVTVSSEAGGGISVWSLREAKAHTASESVNRISFAVPVYFQAKTTKPDR